MQSFFSCQHALDMNVLWLRTAFNEKKKEKSVLMSFKACMTFFIGAQKEDLFWEPFALVNAGTVNMAFKLHRGPPKIIMKIVNMNLWVSWSCKKSICLRKRWKFKSKCTDNLVLQHKELTWRIRSWCNQVISERSYVTQDHKTSHKGQFFKIEIYTSPKSWINKLSIDVLFVRIWQYLAKMQLFENLKI